MWVASAGKEEDFPGRMDKNRKSATTDTGEFGAWGLKAESIRNRTQSSCRAVELMAVEKVVRCSAVDTVIPRYKFTLY